MMHLRSLRLPSSPGLPPGPPPAVILEAVSAVIAAVIKAGVPIYIAALIASALLLFLPDSAAHQIGIAEFRQGLTAPQ
jgi:hypothetical protein